MSLHKLAPWLWLGLVCGISAGVAIAVTRWLEQLRPPAYDLKFGFLVLLALCLTCVALVLSYAFLAIARTLRNEATPFSTHWYILRFLADKPDTIVQAVFSLFVVSMLGWAYQEVAASEKRDEDYRSLVAKTAQDMSELRAALAAFYSQCAPEAIHAHIAKPDARVSGMQPSVSDAESCAIHYKSIVDGWVKASWSVPLFIHRAKPLLEGEEKRGDISWLKRRAIAALKVPEDPIEATSAAHRAFRRAYSASVRRLPGSWSQLAHAVAELDLESHQLGCALVIAAYPVGSDENEISSTACERRFASPTMEPADPKLNLDSFFVVGWPGIAPTEDTDPWR